MRVLVGAKKGTGGWRGVKQFHPYLIAGLRAVLWFLKGKKLILLILGFYIFLPKLH